MTDEGNGGRKKNYSIEVNPATSVNEEKPGFKTLKEVYYR